MHRHRFDILLAVLTLFLLSVPVTHALSYGPRVTNFVMATSMIALLISAAFAVSQSRRTVVIGLSLAVPSIVLRILNLAIRSDGVLITEHLLESLFLGYVIFVLLKHIFVAQRVSLNTICASLCTYLLLGLLWSMIYSAIDLAQPGSFAFPLLDESRTGMMRFSDERTVFPIYFSFVTMTTLGYGDIVPVSALARMLAAMQALTGQLYLAVLVARLVGIHVSQEMREKKA